MRSGSGVKRIRKKLELSESATVEELIETI